MTLSEMWVLDATLAGDGPPYPFVPVEVDEHGLPSGFLVGMTFVSDCPPGEFVGVIHADGDEACEAWVEEHREFLATLGERR
jgi:hypothetical protein